MADINYEGEVKKVFPDAEHDYWPIPDKGKSKLEWSCEYCINATPYKKYTDISGMCSTIQLAWQSAYHHINNIR